MTRAIAHAELGTPVDAGVRVLARALLDDAVRAAGRLDDAGDAEALHDFRVALRRLRSTLRAYDPYLTDGVPRRLRRRLRDVTRATGDGRDAEVALAWVRKQTSGLAPGERAGARWLADRLEARRADVYEAVRRTVRRRFIKLELRLRKRLRAQGGGGGGAPGNGVPRPSFGGAAAELLHALAANLAARLAELGDASDRTAAHTARLAAKRLRYVLEPVADAVPGGARLAARLKRLQDLLGSLDETHLIVEQSAGAVEAVAAERARREFDRALSARLSAAGRSRDPRPGLAALARRAVAQRARLFALLRRQWLGTAPAAFAAELDAAAQTLNQLPAAAAPPAPRRRYRRPARGVPT